MIKTKIASKKVLFITLSVLILAGGFLYFRNSQDNSSQISEDVSKPEALVNFDPPTEQEKQSGDAAKSRVLEREQARNSGDQTTSSGKKAVTPTITYAGQYGTKIEVGAYVNVFEDGGTCIAKFSYDSKSVSKTVQAVRSANSTDCPVMSASREELSPKGTWSVFVTYNSPTASGISNVRMVEVK